MWRYYVFHSPTLMALSRSSGSPPPGGQPVNTAKAAASQQAPRVAPVRKRLDITSEIDRIKGMYKERERLHANFLIIGNAGKGKTYGMRNAPGPVLLHSFDTGGAISLQDAIDDGTVIADRRFEGDSAVNPFAYRLWEKEFRRLQTGQVFEQIGTYVIDSWTTFSASIMYEILKARGRKPDAKLDLGKDPDIVPELSDYNVQQKTLMQWVAEICALPCHVVFLAHYLINEDPNTKQTYASVMMDGKKFAQMVPSLFDEVYYADSKSAGPGKVDYFYRTVPMGMFNARSRMSRGGLLGAQEPQNLREVLKKAGFSYEDVVIPDTPEPEVEGTQE
jgi:hypothetical protein